MNSLFIDTATDALILILCKNNQVVDAHFEIVSRDHASKLLPNIEMLVKRNQLKSKDLHEIYVSEGPGSYTGIRIGVTVAKILSYSLQIPLFAISSLKVIASSYIKKADYLIPLIDARRGNVFSALYQVKNDQLETLLPESLYPLQHLIDIVNQSNYKNVLFVGIDSSKFNIIDESLIRANLEKDFNPHQVMSLAFNKIENIHEFVPSYKRLSEAERNLL